MSSTPSGDIEVQQADLPKTLDAPARLAGPLWAVPVGFFLCLYMLGTGRWGSYVGVPGAPFYVGDMALAAACVQTAILVRLGRVHRDIDTTVYLLIALCVPIYAVLRLATSAELSTTALRDFAPYGYAVIAVTTVLVPTLGRRPWRSLIYATMTVHAAGVALAPELPGFPWGAPVLGVDAAVAAAAGI